MTEKELLHLADLYLEGRTTLEQERQLRRAIPESRSADSRVEEALAVMSFASVAGRRLADGAVASHRSSLSRRPLLVAASVALLLSVGAWLGRCPADAPECSAVIACVESTDPGVALALMESQLGDISEASDGIGDNIREDFAMIGDAMEAVQKRP